MTQIELAVQDVEGVRTAAAVGADRVELCSALPLGGLTPSHGAIMAARRATIGSGLELHVLIRPRVGGFVFDADEADICLLDVESAVAAGADGVVVGCLTEDGRVDRPLLNRLVAAAGDAAVTFHRAIDVAADPEAAIPVLVQAGVRRVLSSGGADTAVEGADMLARLLRAADGRIDVMAGAGVTPATVSTVLSLGVSAVHASVKRPESAVLGVALGSGTDSAQLWRTDASQARALVDAVRSHDEGTR